MTSTLTNASNYQRGDILYTIGEDSNCLYLIVSGEVILFSGDSKKLVPVNTVTDKDFLGEQSLFAKNSRKLHAIVSKSSQIIKIEACDVDNVLNLCPEWVSDIMKLLGERLQSTNYALYEHNIINETDGELSEAEIKFFREKLEDYLSN